LVLFPPAYPLPLTHNEFFIETIHNIIDKNEGLQWYKLKDKYKNIGGKSGQVHCRSFIFFGWIVTRLMIIVILG